MFKLVSISTINLVLISCSQNLPSRNALSLDEFESVFMKDCENIRTIYKGNESSGYFLSEYSDGNYTQEAVTLAEMELWLKQCGVDLNRVSRILED